MLTDFFAGSAFEVELEKELSKQRQLLDVVILRKRHGEFVGRLPDGLDNLSNHNLITFKSHHEALDDWAFKELTGHYVNYRKQLSNRREPLVPESEFRRYAVCSRFPDNLTKTVALQELQAGVYRRQRGTDAIQVVVACELPQAEQNAPLHLFTASAERVEYGRRTYRQRIATTSTVLNQLLGNYRQEGVTMPYTIADFEKDYVREHIKSLTAEERVEGLSLEERLLDKTPEQIERYLRKLKSELTAKRRKPKR